MAGRITCLSVVSAVNVDAIPGTGITLARADIQNSMPKRHFTWANAAKRNGPAANRPATEPDPLTKIRKSNVGAGISEPFQ